MNTLVFIITGGIGVGVAIVGTIYIYYGVKESLLLGKEVMEKFKRENKNK